MKVGYRQHIHDAIATHIRNAEMTDFSGVAEAKSLKQW
jgi:hypothetical protein